jgi:hypothetical protein
MMTLVSCSKDDNETYTEDFVFSGLKGESEDGLRLDCFKLVFPINMVLPDGSVVTLESPQDAKEFIRTWKEENQDVDVRPVIEFPIEVIKGDGETYVLSSSDEVKALVKECRKKKGKKDHDKGDDVKHKRHLLGKILSNDCYSVVFPISFTMVNGDIIEVAALKSLNETLAVWKKSHPDLKGKPQLNFPISVVLPTADAPLSIGSIEELKELIQDCKG